MSKLTGLLADYLNADPTDPRYRMSPDPSTGGSVPLPSFDENGEYFPPTPVPFRTANPSTADSIREAMSPKDLQELLKKARRAGVPKKLSF